jgi:hypothetical protein
MTCGDLPRRQSDVQHVRTFTPQVCAELVFGKIIDGHIEAKLQ